MLNLFKLTLLFLVKSLKYSMKTKANKQINQKQKNVNNSSNISPIHSTVQRNDNIALVSKLTCIYETQR